MAFFLDDEEMGKKDDEYKPGARRVWKQRQPSQVPPRRSVRRAALTIVAILVFFYVLKTLLVTKGNLDADVDEELHPIREVLQGNPNRKHTTSTRPPTPKATGAVERNFNGPIKFYDLAATLHIAGRLMGSNPYNQNVLFAAASLKSATVLLPIACEMAIQGRNSVHFAFLGREDIPIDLLKSVNGISKDCKIMFHDARPDFAPQSTDFRMEVSCSAAYNHINTYVHPQATILDGSGLEEAYFLSGLKKRASTLGNTLIDLPENAEQSLMWITLLDSASLAAWNRVTIDILIHAQSSVSGSLIRLLESLRKADYFSSALPRLTVELPHIVDDPTTSYLRDRFRWPPGSDQTGTNLLSLHHRIPQTGLTVEENSIRFVESFWPANPVNSHILVLSPHVELSPLYFHYLKYAILDWKYSTRQYDASNLLGLSLDLPQTLLDGTTKLQPPLFNESATPFLWQAPNSNAMLYFGERWVELHDFITNILVSQNQRQPSTTLIAKQVSKVYPSWLEQVLRLARARGYSTIYPNFESGDSLATIHTDLYQLPEEHKPMLSSDSAVELEVDVQEYIAKQKEQRLVDAGLLGFVKDGGSLPLLADAPTITFDGKLVEWVEMEKSTEAFVTVFRKEIGGCDVKDIAKATISGKTQDLFCFDTREIKS